MYNMRFDFKAEELKK